MIRKLIPKPIRRVLSHLILPKSPVLWANWGPVSQWLAHRIRPQSPPVVILSLARSGSSWVGDILGTSLTAMYLREPINLACLKEHPTKPSDFEFDMGQPPAIYESSAKNIFSGLPLFNSSITLKPKQWSLLKRKHRRVVIKEVNPFMLGWLIKTYQPRIIYLLRHPVAVTYSFERMGWTGNKFESRLTKETLSRKVPHYKQFTDSFWSEHGAFQGYLNCEIMEQAKAYKDFRVVKYEDLCADPLNEFKKLYEFAQLEWDRTVEEKIKERTQPAKTDDHAFSTQRNSAYEMEKWKHAVPEDKIQQLKEAYLSFDVPFYRDNW